MTQPIAAYTAYDEALATGNMPGVAAALHADVVWHQPGAHSLSGDHRGPDGVMALLGGFMERSGGTFTLTKAGPAMVNGQYVAQPVSFAATRDGHEPLDMAGVDVFRIEDDLIKEVWLYSSDQAVEDAFWS
ncbi:nuclear transport factor 2 family protein [Aeromicrobium sp.]|uniref:nuclear transport factor 2 family protein n=1 Tax=Aeromicrobium sp. TaxID=1871063 RepID=UPI002FC90838